MQKKRFPSRNGRRKGFTLMEVLIVMAILVILGTVVVGNFTNILGNSRKDAAMIQMQSFETPLNMYQLNVGNYPVGLEDLIAVPTGADAEKWRGPYLNGGEVPKDPWGNDYEYTKNDVGYTISATPPDGDPIEFIVTQ
ncbi:MAG: type II secretion system protein GspG [Planctomycetota bacterium]|nr:type II secretion system protein GspG [Planctomycetota bacterium]